MGRKEGKANARIQRSALFVIPHIGDRLYIIIISIGVNFCGNHAKNSSIYDRLFYGTNPPSLRKDGERLTPSWTDAELAGLKAVLEEGIKILQSAI